MKNTFKRVVSSLLILCVLLVVTLAPVNAYADELNSGGASFGKPRIDISGHHNRTTFNIHPRDEYYGPQESSSFLRPLIEGAMHGAGLAIGAAAVCYGADAIATAFFPPAIILAVSCPGIGVAAGGGSAVAQGVQAFAK
jgi:hypothetical protein